MVVWWESCEKVHCGFWVNLDAEWGIRSTLTLPTEWGLILIGFLALFIRLAGSYLWSIICFALHQANASSSNQDDTYHQIQLALRNTDTEASLGWKLFRVGAVHRGSRVNSFGRTGWLIILAMAHAGGVGILGGLSSRFIAGSHAVLAVRGECGWMKEVQNPGAALIKDKSALESFSALVVMARYGYRRSATYARSCYAQTSDNSSSACDIYTKPTLTYNTSLSDGCPFPGKVCNGSAITLDTDHLRSDADLGINTRPESAVTMRQTWSCAPLLGQNYATEWGTAEELGMNETLSGGYNYNVPKDEKRICYTFGTDEQNRTDKLYCLTDSSLKYGDTAYDVKSYTSFVNYNGSYAPLILPVSDFQVPEADTTFIGLINRIAYTTPSQDPWFSAGNQTNDNQYGVTAYKATYPRSFIACTQRYQFCTADKSYCSPYTGVYGIPNNDTEVAALPLNPTQKAVWQLMWKMVWYAQLNFQLIFIGRENLIANDYLWDGGTQFGLSAALPPNHWQAEVSNFMNVSLASLQRAAPSFAQPPEFDIGNPAGAANNNILKYIVKPTDPEMQVLCDSIKMRSNAHTNFKSMGLFLLIGLGLFIMLVNTVLPQIAAWWQMRSGRGYKRLEWIESNAFQLQRMAAEGRGVGPWIGKENDVPTLVNGNDRFNLTGMSLRQKGGEGGVLQDTGYQGYQGYQGAGYGYGQSGYEVVRMGDEMELQEQGVVKGGPTGSVSRVGSDQKLLR